MVLRSYYPGRWEVVGEIPCGPYASCKWGLVYGVTGTLTPDATCNYEYFGEYEGKQYFRREDGNYFLWWKPLDSSWNISELLGDEGVESWKLIDPCPAGVYTPQGTATGDATVILGEHP